MEESVTVRDPVLLVTRCMGQLESMGVRDPALVEAFPRAQQSA